MDDLKNIQSMIFEIRGYQVMLDADLARIYHVETRRLNEAVKRNIGRFPLEFMFQLTKDEYANLMSQFAASSWGGRRKLPFAFTEHGVIMLSSVLNSKIATQINIAIVKTFIDMRRYITKHAAIINEILSSLNNMLEAQPKSKRKIGFNPD
jgi:hypothetical protein